MSNSPMGTRRGARLRLWTLALLPTLWIAAPSHSATISGHTVIDGRGAAKDVAVSLEGDRKSEPMDNAVVDQRHKMFIPHVSVVTKGTTVRFPNDDTVYHNVFAYFQAKRFDLGMYPQGASKKVTFDKSGLVVLLCNVHSSMSAYIMVVDTPYHAVSQNNGTFEIPDVSPGVYKLTAWHESGVKSEQTIRVGSGDQDITVRLAK